MNAVIKRRLMKSLVKLSRKPQAKVFLEKLEGFVLDIGAGGEGTMAKTCGRETVCVDISKREIDEARSRGAVANWVLCDACVMPFGNGTFDMVTFFFSLMYIKTVERKHTVMVEAKRVLKSDGLLYLWDATIREKPDLYVVFVEANLPDGEKIYTGYGVKGKGEKEQTLELINKLALETGFRVTRTESHKNWFTACFHRKRIPSIKHARACGFVRNDACCCSLQKKAKLAISYASACARALMFLRQLPVCVGN